MPQPSLQTILGFAGERIAQTPEATPHEQAVIFSNAVEGS